MSSFFLNYVFDYLLAPLESMIVLVDGSPYFPVSEVAGFIGRVSIAAFGTVFGCFLLCSLCTYFLVRAAFLVSDRFGGKK